MKFMLFWTEFMHLGSGIKLPGFFFMHTCCFLCFAVGRDSCAYEVHEFCPCAYEVHDFRPEYKKKAVACFPPRLKRACAFLPDACAFFSPSKAFFHYPKCIFFVVNLCTIFRDNCEKKENGKKASGFSQVFFKNIFVLYRFFKESQKKDAM